MSVRAAAALVWVVLAAAACTDQPEDRVVGGTGGVPGSTTYSVAVPSGQLVVEVGERQDRILRDEAADGQEHPAPEGTEWVAVDWRFSDDGLDPLVRTLMEDNAQRTRVALVTGGATVEVGDAPGSAASPASARRGGVVYVAVETSAAPVVEVTFDGVTTSLDTATGEVSGDGAAAMAGLPVPVSAACPPLAARGVTADVACTWTVAKVPYLAGRGWSTGDGWTVAQVETRVDSFARGDTTYGVQSATDGSTLDGGAAPSTVVDERFTSLITRSVVDGDASRLEIARTLTGLRDDGPGPEDATVTLTGEVDLP